MIKETTKKQKTTKICPSCKGINKRKVCHTCGGEGVLQKFESSLLFWGKRLDIWHVTHDRLTENAKKILVAALLAFSLFGKLALVLYIRDASQFSTVPLFSIWLDSIDYRIAFGWISLALDTYLIYFLTTAIESRHTLTKLKNNNKDSKNISNVNVALYTSEQTLNAIENAWKLADKFDQPALLPFHVFSSLLDTPPIKTLFARLGISYKVLSEKLAHQFAEFKMQNKESIEISQPLRDILIKSYKISYAKQKEYVDETSILAAISEKDELVREILYDLNVDAEKLSNVIHWVDVRTHITARYRQYRRGARFKPKGSMDRAMTALATPYLDRYSTDLTRLARQGYLELTIGRESEFEQLFGLVEGGRSSVVLVGPPGVGKTAMLYGLAQFMTEERVPKLLQDKRLINLDAARLVSGATASVAAERLLKISDEIRRARNIVLTIENVHSLIGISTGAEESMDLVDVLGSVIGNKQFVVIATSEPPTYGEKQTNTTLGQIFKILQIVEPEKNLAIRIVEAKTMVLEFKHKIFFSYDAIAELINLSFRYLPDEYMPEKAIILLEEIALLKTKTKKKNDTVVRIEDVAEVVSRKIKIPVSEVSQKESDMLLHLEDLIHKRLIDQEEAVGAVSRALRRARAELTSDKRPIANFLFLGPTGVGKTQLAKTVAEIYFGSENNMVRLDMSEYQDSSSSDKLIGGAGISGFLTTQIKEKPFSILLLDELEKAHGDILNLFLQIMDDGRLTDGTGRVIDFTNVIIIATSNAGSQYIQDSIRDKRPVERITHELISGELSKHYRPELLNRFDGIIVFKPLSIKDVVAIARLMVEDVRVNLEEKHGVMLEIQEDALNQLATIGYEPEFGARPMRRAIQNNLDNPLATLILEKKVERRDTVQYTLKGLVVVKGKPL